MSYAFNIFALLFAAHALADYPLQGDWLSKAKNYKLDLVPGEAIWPLALLGHAAIHGAAVYFITGSTGLAYAEFILHSTIDWMKCDGRLTYNQDQYAHVGCKLAWAIVVYGASL